MQQPLLHLRRDKMVNHPMILLPTVCQTLRSWGLECSPLLLHQNWYFPIMLLLWQPEWAEGRELREITGIHYLQSNLPTLLFIFKSQTLTFRSPNTPTEFIVFCLLWHFFLDLVDFKHIIAGDFREVNEKMDWFHCSIHK